MHAFLEALEEFVLLVRASQAIGERQFPYEPIDFRQRRILRTLREEGPITLSGLARHRHVSRQYVKKAIQPSVQIGFIQKKPNPIHKGSKLFSLTAEGRHYIDAHDVKVEEVIGRMLGVSELTEEMQGCISTVRKARLIFDDWLLREM